MDDRRLIRLPGRQVLPDRKNWLWPNDKRIAVIFTANCYCSEAVSVHHMLASSLDYGPNRGAIDLSNWLADLGVPATFNIAGTTARIRPNLLRNIRAAGHEIGVLGERFEPHWFMSFEEEHSLILAARDAVADAIGMQPSGWRTPQSRPSMSTLPLLAQAGFVWDSSLRNDELPYAIEFDEGYLVEIPAGGPSDDSGYVGFPAPITPPSLLLSVWRDEFDMLYEESALNPTMLTISLSPSFMGRRVGLSILRDLIQHIGRYEGVWFATCGEIATWWQQMESVKLERPL